MFWETVLRYFQSKGNNKTKEDINENDNRSDNQSSLNNISNINDLLPCSTNWTLDSITKFKILSPNGIAVNSEGIFVTSSNSPEVVMIPNDTSGIHCRGVT